MNQGMREGLERLAETAREAIGLLDDESGESTDFLDAVRRVEVAERIAHGVKLRLLAEADRHKAARAGIGAWLSAELGYGSSRARGLAEEARRIGAMPELAETLTAGELNQDQTRVIERAVKAAPGCGIDAGAAAAETLTVIEREGVGKAKARVRVLEETPRSRDGEGSRGAAACAFVPADRRNRGRDGAHRRTPRRRPRRGGPLGDRPDGRRRTPLEAVRQG